MTASNGRSAKVGLTGGRLARVFIFGPPGSGKTTLGRGLAAALDLQHVELDELMWGPRWTMRDDATFLASVEAAADLPRWAINGSFRHDVAALVWPKAEVVIWLDYPFPLVAARLIRRTLRRAVTRERLWHGNVEPLRDLVGRASLFAWLCRHSAELPRLVAEFVLDAGLPDKALRFTSPAATAAWCRTICGPWP